MAWVMNTRSFQMIGVEFPRSGRGARQRTFWFVLQFSGSFFSEVTPVPRGPRHWGQLAAWPVGDARMEMTRRTPWKSRLRFMRVKVWTFRAGQPSFLIARKSLAGTRVK